MGWAGISGIRFPAFMFGLVSGHNIERNDNGVAKLVGYAVFLLIVQQVAEPGRFLEQAGGCDENAITSN